MRKTAEYITHYLVKHDIISKTEEDIYVYGTELLLEGCLSILLCISFSFIFNLFWECIVLLLIFIPIRVYGGGLHFSSYPLCLFVTFATVFTILFISKNNTFNRYALLTISVVSLVSISYLYPVEHPNRPVSEAENNNFCHKFKLIIIFNAIFLFTIFFFHLSKWLSLFSLTYFVITISMILGKFNNQNTSL